jgi:hypothetical protein
MALKVFISYSHKDETYKETLDEHLSLLKRNEIIDTWNDRRLIAGQKWENEISENLFRFRYYHFPCKLKLYFL